MSWIADATGEFAVGDPEILQCGWGKEAVTL